MTPVPMEHEIPESAVKLDYAGPAQPRYRAAPVIFLLGIFWLILGAMTDAATVVPSADSERARLLALCLFFGLAALCFGISARSFFRRRHP